jgi:hypothetical protein
MPHSAIFRSSDHYDHQRSLRAEAVDLVVTAPGDFRGEVTRIDVDRLWLQRSRESLPRVVHATVSKPETEFSFSRMLSKHSLTIPARSFRRAA